MFHNLRADPEFSLVMINSYTHSEDPYLEYLAHSRSKVEANLLLKMLEKWSMSCTPPEVPRIFLKCSTFTRTKSNHKWSIAATSGLKQLHPHFPTLTEFRSIYTALLVMDYFPHYNLFPTDEILLATHYFMTIVITNIQVKHILQFHQSRQSQWWPVNATYTGSNHLHSPCIP